MDEQKIKRSKKEIEDMAKDLHRLINEAQSKLSGIQYGLNEEKIKGEVLIDHYLNCESLYKKLDKCFSMLFDIRNYIEDSNE